MGWNLIDFAGRGERAGRQGNSNSFLSESYAALFRRRQKHNPVLSMSSSALCKTPRAYLCPCAGPPLQRAELLAALALSPGVAQSCGAALLLQNEWMPPRVLTACCSRALLPATGVKPSSVILAVKNLSYPSK